MGAAGALAILSDISSGISAVSTISAGFSADRAARQEAGMEEQQAQLQMQDAVTASRQKARDVLKTVARQSMQYAGSGVTLEGSPLLVLNETRQLGQEEINAIYNRGKAVMGLGYQKAAQVRNAGRNALFGGITQAGVGLLNNYVDQKQTKVKSNYAGPWAASAPSVTSTSPISLWP